MTYRGEIEGPRAIAVPAAVLFHTGLGIACGGYVGVDAFFGPSGHLIASIVAREAGAGTFTLRDFQARRIRRIPPALAVVLVAAGTVAALWMLRGDFEWLGKSAMATAAFASNVFFWSEVGPFDTAVELKPLVHTWSLAIGEQF